MAAVKETTFENTGVTVDGMTFEGCAFIGASLVYNGGELPTFKKCSFENISLEFGEDAENTLIFLSSLYQRGFTRSVENILGDIGSPAGSD